MFTEYFLVTTTGFSRSAVSSSLMFVRDLIQILNGIVLNFLSIPAKIAKSCFWKFTIDASCIFVVDSVKSVNFNQRSLFSL